MKIIYISPAVNNPTGGIKVIYKHSEILSKLGFDCSVFHPTNQDFVCNWFEHETIIRKSGIFDPLTDFIVIPEMWAIPFAKKCQELGLKYAIFVQNGYLINAGVNIEKYDELRDAYEQAKLILSISDDTTDIIKTTYPFVGDANIFRIIPHVNENFVSAPKRNIISYMPRKLNEHAHKVCFYLREHLPSDWELKPIHNLQEKEVAKILSETSIFLSFCDQEGCPLPPLEAANSGALVIGYTGQGAKEYFTKPNFISVENGDFKSFVNYVVQSLGDINDGLLYSKRFISGVEKIKENYGKKNEAIHLLNFAKSLGNVEFI